jgi:hypothetical protein
LLNYVNIYFVNSKKILGTISPNVPAVYDVFAARIRACVARPGLQKCGWSEPWERSDLGERNPGAAEGGGAYTDLLCAVGLFTQYHSMKDLIRILCNNTVFKNRFSVEIVY